MQGTHPITKSSFSTRLVVPHPQKFFTSGKELIGAIFSVESPWMDGLFFVVVCLAFFVGWAPKIGISKNQWRPKKIQNDFWFHRGPWELPVAKPTSRRPIFTPNERCFFLGGQTEPQIRTLCESGFIFIFLRKKVKVIFFLTQLEHNKFPLLIRALQVSFLFCPSCFSFSHPKKSTLSFFCTIFFKTKILMTSNGKKPMRRHWPICEAEDGVRSRSERLQFRKFE